MRSAVLFATLLAPVFATSCLLDPILDSDGPLVVVADPDEEDASSPVDDLETGRYRESDGQLVVQVFNRGRRAVRDVEIEVDLVNRKGRRIRGDRVTIGRRIGAGSMDQTRTSLFVEKKELERIEIRVLDADPD